MSNNDKAYLSVERRGNTALIWMDNPDEKVNVLNAKLLDELPQIMNEIAKDDEVEAVVFASAKSDTFIAGADLEMLKKMESEDDVTRFNLIGNELLDRVESFEKPVVAAIHGAALGGGLEVAMACHYRLATDSTKTRFGLPEVNLGLLPGGGGTQRLPHLVGLQKALDIMLTGKNIFPRQAKRMGLIDELIHKDALIDVAVKTAEKLATKSTKQKKQDSRSLLGKVLDSNSLTRSVVYSKAKEMVMKKTMGNYPAPLRIIECVKAGIEKGYSAGRDTETKYFTELVFSPESKALVNLFFAMNEVKKNPLKAEAKEVRTIGMLGAGLMGSGIAQVSAEKGDYNVILKDRDLESASKGLKAIYDDIHKKTQKRIITKFDEDKTLAKITPTGTYSNFKTVQLVIEAVFEYLNVKHNVLAECEKVTPETMIFASNTSSLPITEIARKSKHPEQVIGMHYFSPVPKMPLLEIIKTDKTADWVVATAYEVGLKQGKTVIVVNDGPGFYTTRILAPYMNEAILLLEEGAKIEQVDKAMKRWGFPVGPVVLMDEVGIDVGAHVTEVLSGMFAKRGMKGSDIAGKLVEAGYKGRKNKKGFYRYEDGKSKKKVVNSDIYTFFGGSNRKRFENNVIQDRMSMMMVNEAAHCLQDGILESPRDGDLGAILGLGFAPFRGGPFRYMDSIGLKATLDTLNRLSGIHGNRFKPAQLLIDMAGEGKTFYS